MLVGAVVVIISGSSMVYVAAKREGEGERRRNAGFSAEDRTPAIDARIAFRLASFKERLRLTPEQEKNWPASESALQAMVKLRRERMEAGPERPSDPVQRMRQRAEALSAMGAALSRLADAQGPLYNSLDEGQRRRFPMLSQILGDQSDMHRRSLRDDDRRSWRGRDDDDGRSRRGRDDDDRRGWRGRDDDDRRGWRDRDDGDRRGWRGRDDDDRRGWRGRDDDDRRGWRDRDDENRRGGAIGTMAIVVVGAVAAVAKTGTTMVIAAVNSKRVECFAKFCARRQPWTENARSRDGRPPFWERPGRALPNPEEYPVPRN